MQDLKQISHQGGVSHSRPETQFPHLLSFIYSVNFQGSCVDHSR